MGFVKAERKQAKLRLAITSASGGGKTHSALLIARGLGGRIAMIDTEHGSGSLEVGKPGIPEYDVLELDPPFTPKRYIESIKEAEQAGYAVIIIDSLTHEWQGAGGALDMHDKATAASKSGNSYTAWKEVTPEHDKLVNAILQSSCHIIATMRSKQDYIQTDENGRKGVKKLGMAPVQREGMDYEFTVVLDLSQEHIATASKDRTSLFDGQHFIPTEDTGRQLLGWLNSGAPAKAVKPAQVTAPAASPTAVPAPATSDPETEIFGEEKGPEPTTELAGFVDMAVLKPWLQQLQAKKLKAWYNPVVLDKLNSIAGKQAKSVTEAVTALSKEQAEKFLKEVQEAVEMA